MKMKIILAISTLTLVLTVWPTFRLILEYYYQYKIYTDYEIHDIQSHYTEYTLPFRFGENLIDLIYTDLQDDKIEFMGYEYKTGTVTVQNNGDPIFSLRKNGGIAMDESGIYHSSVKVTLIEENKSRSSYIAIVANLTDNTPFPKDKKEQQFALLKIMPHGDVHKSTFSYKNRNSYLETSLVQRVSPIGFGHYSDLNAAYATFMVPLFYPMILFGVGLILSIYSTIRLLKGNYLKDK